ncbi:hypothetical protein FKM82_019968 [Ascaphus truei]
MNDLILYLRVSSRLEKCMALVMLGQILHRPHMYEPNNLGNNENMLPVDVFGRNIRGDNVFPNVAALRNTTRGLEHTILWIRGSRDNVPQCFQIMDLIAPACSLYPVMK